MNEHMNTGVILSCRLDKLKEAIDASGGLIPLAMIKNGKTVDPQDDTSTKVRGKKR